MKRKRNTQPEARSSVDGERSRFRRSLPVAIVFVPVFALFAFATADEAVVAPEDNAAHGRTLAAPGIDSPIKTVYVVLHAHLDIGFTAPPETVAEQYKGILDAHIAHAKAHPDYKWTVEATWQLEQWLQRSTPEEIADLVALEHAGQIRVAAGHSTLHSAKVGAEQTTRLLWNAARYRQRYGFTIRTLHHNDVPGISWAYPQTLVRSGIDYLVNGQNMFIGGSIAQPYKSYLFHWEAPDGSRIPTWSTQSSYAQGVEIFWWVGAVNQTRLAAALKELTDAGYPYDAVMIQTAFDNLSGTDVHAKINNWNATYDNPKLVLAHAEDFFDDILERYADSIPVRSGHWMTIWDTTGIVGAREKKIAKRGQILLPVAEQLNALADALEIGHVPTEAFHIAWDHVLQIDEHSGPGGCWPGYFTQEEVDIQNAQHWNWAVEARTITNDTLMQGAADLFTGAALPHDASILVYNPLSWTRTDLARVSVSSAYLEGGFALLDTETGDAVAWQIEEADSALLFVARDVPSHGYKRYTITHESNGDPETDPPVSARVLDAEARLLENDRYRLELDESGHVTSLLDKATDRELIATDGNFQFNRMIQGTNLQWFFGVHETVDYPLGATTLRAGLDGPVAISLRAERGDHPHAAAEIVLYDGLDRIDFANTADRDRMLHASLADNSRYYGLAYPFALSGFDARFDTAAGWCNPATDMIEGSYRSAFPMHTVLSLAEADYGVAFAAPDVYTHAVGGFQNGTYPPPRATVVSSFIRYGDEAELKGGATGVAREEAEADPQWTLRYSIRPDARGFDPVADARFGWEVAAPLQARWVASAAAPPPDPRLTRNALSFFSVNAPNVIVTSIKKAEFGDGLILKMQEIAGEAITDVKLSSELFGFRKVQPTSPLEEDFGAPLVETPDGALPPMQVAFPIGAREIVALRLLPTLLGLAAVEGWMLH